MPLSGELQSSAAKGFVFQAIISAEDPKESKLSLN